MDHHHERSSTRPSLGAVLLECENDDEPDSKSTSRDLHHDPWLVPQSPDLKSLAEDIFGQLEANHPRPSRQRSDAKARRADITANIVAYLAFVAKHFPVGTRIAISAWNTKQTRYDRPEFPREVFMQIVGEMEQDGLLTLRKGTRGRRRSTIEPTPLFRERLAGQEIAVGRLSGAETVILKAHMGRNRPKQLVPYADTPDTIAMRHEMEAVNAELRAASIMYGATSLPVPVHLTRRFQIDHPDAPHVFNRHGRLYGGFWMSLPKTERYLLRVNGEEVVDLDFSGMFVQLAYLEAGLALPNSDPYGGVDSLPRAAAKMGLSALLCRSGPMQRLPRGFAEVAGTTWTAKRLSAALSERHPGIAHLFGKGIGLKLMKTESDILLATLGQLFVIGIPALPMHDGIMVPAASEEAARRAMARAAVQIVGVNLPVVRKEIIRPANDNSPPME